MQQITLDLECAQSATFHTSMTYTNPDGSPVDLTGWNAVMEVRRVPSSADALVRCTVANNRIRLGGTSGHIDIEIEDTVTADFPPANYRYDLLLIGPHTTVRLLKGLFVVDATVSRR